MIALLFAAQSPCEKQAERKRQTVSVGMKCREVFRDADCLAICPACPPKCYAFRYGTAHQLPEKQFTGLFFYGSCPLGVRVPEKPSPMQKRRLNRRLSALVGLQGLEPRTDRL